MLIGIQSQITNCIFNFLTKETDRRWPPISGLLHHSFTYTYIEATAVAHITLYGTICENTQTWRVGERVASFFCTCIDLTHAILFRVTVCLSRGGPELRRLQKQQWSAAVYILRLQQNKHEDANRTTHCTTKSKHCPFLSRENDSMGFSGSYDNTASRNI